MLEVDSTGEVRQLCEERFKKKGEEPSFYQKVYRDINKKRKLVVKYNGE